MPDPRVLAYHNAAAAYERTRVALQRLRERVQRAAQKLEDLKPVPEVSPRKARAAVAQLQEHEWPSREEINRTLGAVQEAGEELRRAWEALSPEEQALVQASRSDSQTR